jgi:hypothetical protein
MATDQEILKALTVLASAYPRFDLPEQTIRIYQRLLADLDFDLLKAATLQCATTHTFFPAVAEIRAAAVDLKAMADGIPSDIEAWGQVLEQMRKVGSYGTPDFSHPLVDQVVRQMGWINLCMSENQIADRARFLEAYSQTNKVTRRRSQMLPEVLDIVDRKMLSAGDKIKQLAANMEVT